MSKAEITMNLGTQASKATFSREVSQATAPVLVYFYAGLCRPVGMLAPALERLAAEFTGKVKSSTIDVGAEPELASIFS